MIVACVLILQTVHTEQVHSQGIHNIYEWTFEPETNGTLYVKIKITLSTLYSDWSFSSSVNSPSENMKAWEAETGAPLNIKEEVKGDRIHYTIELPGTKGKGFEFYVEYDGLNRVREEFDEVYYFYAGWESPYSTTHSATVTLPKKHELVLTNFIDPVNVSSRADRVYVEFLEEVPEDGAFELGVLFSQKGVQLLNKADSNFRLGQYSDAKRAYQDAINFYSQFSKLYGKDITSFLADLKDKVAECEDKFEEERVERNAQLAEEKYGEAVTAFDAGDYAKAQQLYQQAQNMYLSSGNSEKADECQNYIDQCKQFVGTDQLKSEAESLLNEGISLFGQQQYAEAKTKFEEALAKYTELEDEEKVEECQEWITSCEQEKPAEGEDGGGTCMGTSLVFIALLGAALAHAFRCRR